MPKIHQYLSKILDASKDVHPSPTQPQREAGNYAMGHVSIHGLNITIETAKDQIRTKVGKDGKSWSRKMHAHYGYVRGTHGKDGDHCDIFVGEHPQSQLVFVINQLKKDGSFDEHKIVLGCTNASDAKELYLKHYPKDWKGFGSMKPMFMKQFKTWVFNKKNMVKAAELGLGSLAMLAGIPTAALGAGLGAYTAKPGERLERAARLGAAGFLTGQLATLGGGGGAELAKHLGASDSAAQGLSSGGAVAGGLSGLGLGYMLYGTHWGSSERRQRGQLNDEEMARVIQSVRDRIAHQQQQEKISSILILIGDKYDLVQSTN